MVSGDRQSDTEPHEDTGRPAQPACMHMNDRVAWHGCSASLDRAETLVLFFGRRCDSGKRADFAVLAAPYQ